MNKELSEMTDMEIAEKTKGLIEEGILLNEEIIQSAQAAMKGWMIRLVVLQALLAFHLPRVCLAVFGIMVLMMVWHLRFIRKIRSKLDIQRGNLDVLNKYRDGDPVFGFDYLARNMKNL